MRKREQCIPAETCKDVLWIPQVEAGPSFMTLFLTAVYTNAQSATAAALSLSCMLWVSSELHLD